MRDNSPVKDLINEAIQLHNLERSITLKSTLLVARLEDMRASLLYGLSTADFAQMIGLSLDQYWKRSQAARILRAFPETKTMLEKGETSVSVISMLSARITEANADILLAGIKNKNKRQVKELLSVVTLNGQILEKEPIVEIRLTLTKSQMAKLDRAVEVLAARGKNPGLNEVMVQALEDLLQRRDPVEKAARAQKIAERRTGKMPEVTAPAQLEYLTEELEFSSLSSAPAQSELLAERQFLSTFPSVAQPTKRNPVPSSVRHQVWLRDQGQCTWQHRDGKRCGERKMLELDHLLMVCRGGLSELGNLTLRCRFHNQIRAEILLGRTYMEQRRLTAMGWVGKEVDASIALKNFYAQTDPLNY